MRLSSRIAGYLALTITASWALSLAFSGSTDVLLYLAPALLIVVPLLAGRYVGESLIVKLAAKDGRKRRSYRPSSPPPPKAPAIWLPRGTRLIAFSLAERPPPALLLPQT
jgi:hypothetical protein